VQEGINGLSPPETCQDIVDDICGVVGACSCGTCDDEIVDVIECALGAEEVGCPIECP
jgi:hypothetical protein